MLELLCQAAEVFDSATAAGIYDFINSGLRTVLLDEGDIMDFRSNGVLSGLYNSGFQQGRKRRVHGQEYNLFAPMAAAMIGSDTLADAGITRTIFVRMTMASGADLDALRHFDPGEQDFFAAFDALKAALSAWAPDAITTLDRNPKMPSELNGRVRDTWRPLVAIADECGPEFAKLIREASLELTKDTPREALPLSLLRDIWKVYDRRRVDRISSVDLVAALRALPEDERRADWTEWRGIKANLDARPLNPNYLAIVP
jgi:hypothetical protein